MRYFFDTETFGFTGPPVLIQYAIDSGPVDLFCTFKETVGENIELMESMADNAVIGFNLTFDWFMIQKWYNMMLLLRDELGPDTIPMDHIDLLAELEPKARFGPCIKPHECCDLMLVAQSNQFQITMQRHPISVRRVPNCIAEKVRDYLEEKIELPSICFAKSKSSKWKLQKCLTGGEIDPNFVNILLNFQPSGSLKAIIREAGLEQEDRTLYKEVMPARPYELPYAPWALSCSKAPYYNVEKRQTWPAHVLDHVVHWQLPEPMKYATDDVLDTRNLYYYLGEPELNDTDSVLACMAGSIRWKGYAIDVPALIDLDKELEHELATAKVPINPQQVKDFLSEYLTPEEARVLTREHDGGINTSRAALESLTTFTKSCDCPTIEVEEMSTEFSFDDTPILVKKQVQQHKKGCPGFVPHPVVAPAQEIIHLRTARNIRSLLSKLLISRRFHPVVSIVGSLSGRVGGGSKDAQGDKVSNINTLGIPADPRVRALFLFQDEGESFSSGDFEGYEISIADAVWGDEELRRQLLTCNVCYELYTPDQFRELDHCPHCEKSYGFCKKCNNPAVIKDNKTECCGHECTSFEATVRKIHALFAMELFPGNSYNEILASKRTDNDMYDKGKRSLFGGILYGGDANTINRRVGIPLEQAEDGRESFYNRFEGVKAAQERVRNQFCSMRQDVEQGPVTWNEPDSHVSSLLGFRRDFSLENHVCKSLYNIALAIPSDWKTKNIKVERQEGRMQKPEHATMSALFGAAFGIQSSVFRAALNHEIQSTGADLIKLLEKDIWDLQPVGVHEWIVAPLSVHDEIDTPIKKGYEPDVKQKVNDFVETYKVKIPLLKIEWNEHLPNWAEK